MNEKPDTHGTRGTRGGCGRDLVVFLDGSRLISGPRELAGELLESPLGLLIVVGGAVAVLYLGWSPTAPSSRDGWTEEIRSYGSESPDVDPK